MILRGGNHSALSIFPTANYKGKKGEVGTISRWHYEGNGDGKHSKKVGVKYQNIKSCNSTFMSQSSDHTPQDQSNQTTNRDMGEPGIVEAVQLMDDQFKNLDSI